MAVGIRLPGTAGNYVSTPDVAALDLTGDLSLVAYVALTDWTPATGQAVVSKWVTNTGYELSVVATSGLLRLSGDASTYDSSVAPTVSDGAGLWVGVTVDVSPTDTKFWTSSDGSSWSQLGTTVSGPSSFTGNSATLNVGVQVSTVTPLDGTVYSAAVYSGLGAGTAPGQGTLVAEFTAEDCGDRYRDSTGKIWTVNGSAVSTVIT